MARKATESGKDKRKATGEGKGKARTKKTQQKGSQRASRGRKPMWEVLNMPSMLDAVRGWAMQGATDEDLCTMIGVSKTVFYEWKQKYPEFAEALRKGKHVANGELLNSAFRQSVGYSYIENEPVKYKTYETFTDPKTGEGVLRAVEKVIVVPVEKFVYPNATITQFMLKNRMPEHYREKQQIEHIGGNNYDYLSDEELDAELEKLGDE